MHSATSLQGSGLVRTVGPCAQTRVAIEMHSRTSSPLSRLPSLEQSERRGGLFFVIPVNSLIDSTFERSENITLAHFLMVSSSSCCWPAVRGVAYAILGSKFVRYYLRICTVLTEIMDFL